MALAILLSTAAGIASALLWGILSPGTLLTAFLFFLAPLPLMIAGLGWHPLLAALGGLIACALMSAVVGGPIALPYAAIVAIPSYIACEGLQRHFQPGPPVSGGAAGRQLVVPILAGIGAWSVLLSFAGALTVDFDHAAAMKRLADLLEQIFRAMLAGPKMPSGRDISLFAEIYAGIVPPLITVIFALTLSLSLWLAVVVTRRSGRLAFEVPPLFLANLPRGAIPALLGLIVLAQSPGWLGYIGLNACVMLGYAFTLVGLAVLHMRTLGRANRGAVLGAVWVSILLIGLPLLVFTIVGLLDAFFDFRRLGQGGTPPRH